MKQKEYIGFGAIDNCREILTRLSPNRIFLVKGKTSYSQSGAEGSLKNILVEYEVFTYTDFECNPKIEDLRRGLKLCNDISYDTVIAIGGGSVIDMAKLLNFFNENKQDPVDYINGDIGTFRKARPLIAIPTTAGSGSEATHFAVMYINDRKYSVAHKTMLPEFSIIDPQLTISLPPKITATSGVDILCHAIESYWNINSTNQTKNYAKKAIELVWVNLSSAVNHATESSRLALAEAAHLAGKAINITKTSASHAISYPLTAHFNIPHGHAVILTLASLLVYNYYVTEDDLLDRRGCDYVRKTIREIICFLGAENIDIAREKLNTLMKNIGLETRLGELGIESSEELEKIVKEVNPERAKNNPRKLTLENVRQILHSIS